MIRPPRKCGAEEKQRPKALPIDESPRPATSQYDERSTTFHEVSHEEGNQRNPHQLHR